MFECEWSTQKAEEQPWLSQTASKLQLNTHNHLESSRGRVSRWGHPLQGKQLKYLKSFANQRWEISIDAVALCSKTKWAAYLDSILGPHRQALKSRIILSSTSFVLRSEVALYPMQSKQWWNATRINSSRVDEMSIIMMFCKIVSVLNGFHC